MRAGSAALCMTAAWSATCNDTLVARTVNRPTDSELVAHATTLFHGYDRPIGQHTLASSSLSVPNTDTKVVAMSQTSTEAERSKSGEPTYRLERHTVDYDIRVYAPYLVAEVIVPGPAESASSEGFRLLAAYIFGGNSGSNKLAMTAPVTQTPVKLPMTVPVTQSQLDDGFRVRFVMPSGYTLATLPMPNNGRVTLSEVPAQRVAVRRYSGRWTEKNYDEHVAELRASLAAAGLVTHGAPILARYNAPYVPPFLRRNEVWLTLD